MLEIGNFGADDLELGRQFLQSFVQEAHLRHPWQATFVSDGDVVALMGDMTKWFVRDMSGEVGPPHQTYYYLIK